jgi:hypothetical protein
MDTASFEKIIQDQLPDIKTKGVLLFNGYAKSMKAYQEDPTAAKQREWQSAEAALKRFVATLEGNHFATIADVLEYLSEEWRVTKTSLYRHHKEGKLLPQADGTYQRTDIDKYSRTWLKQKSTGKRISERIDELQRKKLEKELRNLDLEYERRKFAHEKDLGQFIPRDQMEVELAGRAGILDAGLKHWIQSRTADWVRTVSGDTKKVGELINLMIRDLDEHINSYASNREYQVIIDAPENNATEDGLYEKNP